MSYRDRYSHGDRRHNDRRRNSDRNRRDYSRNDRSRNDRYRDDRSRNDRVDRNRSDDRGRRRNSWRDRQDRNRSDRHDRNYRERDYSSTSRSSSRSSSSRSREDPPKQTETPQPQEKENPANVDQMPLKENPAQESSDLDRFDAEKETNDDNAPETVSAPEENPENEAAVELEPAEEMQSEVAEIVKKKVPEFAPESPDVEMPQAETTKENPVEESFESFDPVEESVDPVEESVDPVEEKEVASTNNDNAKEVPDVEMLLEMEQSPTFEGRDRYQVTPQRYPPGVASQMEDALRALDKATDEIAHGQEENKPVAKPRYSYLEKVAGEIREEDETEKQAFLEQEKNTSPRAAPVIQKTIVQQPPMIVNRVDNCEQPVAEMREIPFENSFKLDREEQQSHLADDEHTEATDSHSIAESSNFGEFEELENEMVEKEVAEGELCANFEMEALENASNDMEDFAEEECFGEEDLVGDEHNPILTDMVQDGNEQDEDEEEYQAEDMVGDDQNPFMMREEIVQEQEEKIEEIPEQEFVLQASGSYSGEGQFLENSENLEKPEMADDFEAEIPDSRDSTSFEEIPETVETIEETIVEELEEVEMREASGSSDLQSGQYVDDLNLTGEEEIPAENPLEEVLEAENSVEGVFDEPALDFVKVDKEEIPQNWEELMPKTEPLSEPVVAAPAMDQLDTSPRRSSRAKKVDYAKLNWGVDESYDKEDQVNYYSSSKKLSQKSQVVTETVEEPMEPVEMAEEPAEEPMEPAEVGNASDEMSFKSPTGFSFECDTTPEDSPYSEEAEPVVEPEEPEVEEPVVESVEEPAIEVAEPKPVKARKTTPKRKSSKKATPKKKTPKKEKKAPKVKKEKKAPKVKKEKKAPKVKKEKKAPKVKKAPKEKKAKKIKKKSVKRVARRTTKIQKVSKKKVSKRKAARKKVSKRKPLKKKSTKAALKPSKKKTKADTKVKKSISKRKAAQKSKPKTKKPQKPKQGKKRKASRVAKRPIKKAKKSKK